MTTKLVTSRLITREAARHVDQDTPHAMAMSAMAKLHATDECFEVYFYFDRPRANLNFTFRS